MLKDNSEWLGPGGSNKDGYAVFGRVVSGWPLVREYSLYPTVSDGGVSKLTPPLPFIDVVSRQGRLDRVTLEDVGKWLRWT